MTQLYIKCTNVLTGDIVFEGVKKTYDDDYQAYQELVKCRNYIRRGTSFSMNGPSFISKVNSRSLYSWGKGRYEFTYDDYCHHRFILKLKTNV